MNDSRSKTFNAFSVALGLAFFLCSSAFVPALAASQQQQPPQPEEKQREETPEHSGRKPNDGRFNLIGALNLTPEQRVQIRAIRVEYEAPTRAALRRRGHAQRALEEAIYADQVDEGLIAERTREVAEAQAELVRLRARVELSIRRLLTPEQLTRFRELRRQRRPFRGDRPKDSPPQP